ncbi:zinc ribbon domain-containing protein [Nocardioides panaciterrulae]|uniref:Putative membrane protein YhdT n=1 Tax=Nocardioides panaciterrulae TaxID=661492 RepID=A0A7Y9E933_9ACTN|nr:zinc ribbon domain-containing protein [Nocardioides panaciterrulae]NYD43364.1 putative membrane protein YhdT [Nocardioides panaciterrulae]
MSNNPGLVGQARYRNAFRAAGAVLLIVGIVVFGYGIVSVFGSDGFPGGWRIACFIGGLPLIGFGMMLLQAGFLGAAARYGAGETMPVVRDSASYLTDGQGILGVGRTVDDGAVRAAGGSGPYCRACGVRNDADARFCDGCGASLA